MKLRIIAGVSCPPFNLAHFPGDIVTVEDKMGAEMIEAKVAEKYQKSAAPKSEKATKKGFETAETATKK